MILRRIAQHMKQQHWTGVLIELVIVVVGVFIGLQVNNWNAARIASHNERSMLLELRKDLMLDTVVIKRNLRIYRYMDIRSEKLLHDLSSGKPNTPAMDREFGQVYAFDIFSLHVAGYESLKSQGMDLIKDPALRSEISNVYEQDYPLLDTESILARHYMLEVLQPYYLKHFKNLHVADSATPLDYASIKNDPYYRNIIANHRDLVIRRYIPSQERTLAAIDHLIASIDKQLGEPVPKRSHKE